MKPIHTVRESSSALVMPRAQTADDLDALTGFYREAGKSENSERTYKSAINHYRFEWGGQLPANPDAICRYLTTYAKTLKVSTLRQRLSALAKWHHEQGFSNPVAAPAVKQTMRGIAKHHHGITKQAYPLTFQHLLAICARLESEKLDAIKSKDEGAILRTHRDLSLILMGFWHGFRSDELSRVTAENVIANRHQGITIFLPYSKTDREASGSTYDMPALRAYCPTAAYLDWIQVSGISSGMVFRSISRWGKLADTGIHKQSITHILGRVAADLFPGEPAFSTHSLRRGFADWAVTEGWDMKALMAHVGWLSADSARRYMPTRKDFGSLASNAHSGALANEPVHSYGQTFLADFEKTDKIVR